MYPDDYAADRSYPVRDGAGQRHDRAHLQQVQSVPVQELRRLLQPEGAGDAAWPAALPRHQDRGRVGGEDK